MSSRRLPTRSRSDHRPGRGVRCLTAGPREDGRPPGSDARIVPSLVAAPVPTGRGRRPLRRGARATAPRPRSALHVRPAPYGPGDLIDVDVDEDDHSGSRLAHHFSRPSRLTRTRPSPSTFEAPSWWRPRRAASARPDERARGAERIARSRSAGGGGEAIGATSAGAAPEHLDLVRTAATADERLEVEYFVASTREWSDHASIPSRSSPRRATGTVAAWDVDIDAERLLRIDRIRDAVATGIGFPPRGLEGAGGPL